MDILSKFEYVGKSVRVVSLNGEPWFVAKDLCNILEIKNVSDSLSRLDDDEKGIDRIYTLGGKQDMAIVSESGMYALVLSSRKEEAKVFRKWITSEVLPSIRKNKGYEISQNIYAKRVQIASTWDVPKGYWCVFHEISLLANKVGETYNVKEFDLIDGSVGKSWSKYRKGKPWALPSATFELRFNDRRDLARPEAKAYRNEELFYFRDWLENEYKDVNLPKYLLNKYQGIIKSDSDKEMVTLKLNAS